MIPVCVKCGLEMFPACNEVAVWHPIEPVADEEEIDFVVLGDRWECPKCHASIVTGFGDLLTTDHVEQQILRNLRDGAEEQIRILRGAEQ